MPRSLQVVLLAIAGYLLAALLGYGLVGLLSTNTHDRSVEAAMTGLFFCGPIGALLAGIWGLLRSRK